MAYHWDARFELIIGLTATGRATVEARLLNRPELVNLRRLLYVAGEPLFPAPKMRNKACSTAMFIGRNRRTDWRRGGSAASASAGLQDLTPL
jgi:hypothetical protein